jgi:hypothetical protein
MSEVSVTMHEHQPRSFSLKRRLEITEITDHWSELGRWWEGESPAEFFMVDTAGGQFLLCNNAQEGKWYVKPVH